MRVALDAGAPVFVKAASGPGVARLRRERERLEQAQHPGVVALAGPASAPDATAADDGPASIPDYADGEHELRTWYAGEPLSRWTGSLADVAGLGAAVASTLSDLHQVGVVHGRLDATHVLLGADGRPRLCGFADPGAATPADDVAALGDLVHELTARAPDHRRGLLRSRRASRAGRRALADVVEQATDPVPARRPSARRLADAILAAVPGARLPDGPGSPVAGTGDHDVAEARAPWPEAGGPRPARPPLPGVGPDLPPALGLAEADGLAWGDDTAPAGRSVPTGRHPRQPDTLDRIWSFAGEQSDDERWALALGDGPPDLPPRPSADTGTLPLAPVDTPAWSSTGLDHGDDPTVTRPSSGPSPADLPVDAAGGRTGPGNTSRSRSVPARTPVTGPDDTSPAGAAFDDPPRSRQRRPPAQATADHSLVAEAASSARPTGSRRPSGPAEPAADDGLSAEPTAGHPIRGTAAADHRSSAETARPARPVEAAWPARPGEAADGLTRDHRVAGGRVGVTRRPITADAIGPAGARPRLRAARPGAALLVVALAVGGVIALGSGGGADSSRPDDRPAETVAPGCPAVTAPMADVDGDGCPEHLAVEGTTVDAGLARWTLGEPGDLIALGDWDCDGESSAALLRPTTGDVFLFTSWAETGTPVTVTATHRAVGAVGLRAEADGEGCDRLMVDLTGGGSTLIEVPR